MDLIVSLSHPLQNEYSEALTPSVIVFGQGFWEVIKVKLGHKGDVLIWED